MSYQVQYLVQLYSILYEYSVHQVPGVLVWQGVQGPVRLLVVQVLVVVQYQVVLRFIILLHNQTNVGVLEHIVAVLQYSCTQFTLVESTIVQVPGVGLQSMEYCTLPCEYQYIVPGVLSTGTVLQDYSSTLVVVLYQCSPSLKKSRQREDSSRLLLATQIYRSRVSGFFDWMQAATSSDIGDILCTSHILQYQIVVYCICQQKSPEAQPTRCVICTEHTATGCFASSYSCTIVSLVRWWF
jgi:hypothetical protein